jgi:hypothetical protein
MVLLPRIIVNGRFIRVAKLGELESRVNGRTRRATRPLHGWRANRDGV